MFSFLTYEKLDKLFAIINSLDANFVMIELKKINKDFDNYKNFMKTLTKKRNIGEQGAPSTRNRG